MAAISAWAASAVSQCRMAGAAKPSATSAASRSAATPSLASRSKAKKRRRRSATTAGSLARSVPAAAPRGLISGLSGWAAL